MARSLDVGPPPLDPTGGSAGPEAGSQVGGCPRQVDALQSNQNCEGTYTAPHHVPRQGLQAQEERGTCPLSHRTGGSRLWTSNPHLAPPGGPGALGGELALTCRAQADRVTQWPARSGPGRSHTGQE